MTAAAIPALLNRPLPGDETTLPRRKAALAELEAVGWPTPKRERWRYTNLSALGSTDLDPAPPPPKDADVTAARRWLDSIGAFPIDRRVVLLDGHLVPALGTIAVPGIEVENLARTVVAPTVSTADHPLAAVSTAFGPSSLRIRVAAGVSVAEPFHVVLLASARAAVASQPHVILEASDRASAVVVQHVAALEGAAGWLNAVTELRQAAGSQVELYRVQHLAGDLTHTSLLSAELAADAHLRAGYFDLGGRLIRNDVDVKLAARGARAELFGLLLVPPSQHVDDHVSVDHAAPDTQSEQAFRALVGRRGRGVFNGKVVVRPNAQRIDARQSSDNLLLDEQAEIDAKPELEIYADDVKCSHGTTVGELDAEQLFYLRARGIGEKEARELLTRAFADTLLERIRAPSVREHIATAVAETLAALAEQHR